MIKGLVALENLKREAGTPYFSTFYDIDMWKEDFTTVEKELKVLEIIKQKFDLIEGFYNELLTQKFPLTSEEYDLL